VTLAFLVSSRVRQEAGVGLLEFRTLILDREEAVNRYIAAVLGAAVLLVGCSNVKGEAFTSSNRDQILSDVAKSKLSDDDKKSFLAATMRSALGNYSVDGKTVGQVIDEQKKWQADQDAQAAAAHEAQLKAEAKRAALVAAMQHAISVQPISKRFKDSNWENGDYDQSEYVTFQFHNTGTKAIKGVKGSVRFTNSFGDKVITLELEEGGNGGEALSLRPDYILTDELSWKYNEFEDSWKTFRATELSSMKAEWDPEAIIFTDGTTLTAPDDDSSSS
jgi:hypothetical protein